MSLHDNTIEEDALVAKTFKWFIVCLTPDCSPKPDTRHFKTLDEAVVALHNTACGTGIITPDGTLYRFQEPK